MKRFILRLLVAIAVGSAWTASAAEMDPCGEALVQDPFLRMLERSKTVKGFSIEAWQRLVDSEVPFNPIRTLAKTTDSVALSKAIDFEVAKIDPTRWVRLRAQIGVLILAEQKEQGVRKQAQENSAPILNMRRLHSDRLWNVSLAGIRWKMEGDKLRVTVGSNDDNKWVIQSPTLEIANVTALSAAGLAPADTDLFFARHNNTLQDLRTLEEIAKFKQSDTGLLQMEKPGNFLIRHKENMLYLRPLGRSRWTYWEKTIPIPSSNLTSVNGIGGKEDGYFLLSTGQSLRQSLVRFDGKRVHKLGNIGWGLEGQMQGQPEMIRSSDGTLFVYVPLRLMSKMIRPGEGTHHMLLEVQGDQILPVVDLGTQVLSFRFGRDKDGRVYMGYATQEGITIRFLDQKRESYFIAKSAFAPDQPLNPRVFRRSLSGPFNLIGAFHYRGNLSVAVYRDGKIQILDMVNGLVAAEMPISIRLFGENIFSLFQAPDEQVYLAVHPEDGVFEIYNMISKVGDRGPSSVLPTGLATDCDLALVEDPFLRLLERTRHMKGFSIETWAALAASDRPYNPIGRKAKSVGTLSLIQALDAEVAKIDGERWERLRVKISELLRSARGEAEQSGQAREHTEEIFRLKLVHGQPLSWSNAKNIRWIEDGGKMRLFVGSMAERKTLFESPTLDILNLPGLGEGIAEDTEIARSNGKALNLRTMMEEGNLGRYDVGVVDIANKGEFILRYSRKKLNIRPVGRSRWLYWEKSLPLLDQSLSILTSIHAIGGADDAYVLTKSKERFHQALYRFDGERIYDLGFLNWGTNGKLKASPELIRGREGQLFVSDRLGSVDGGKRTLLLEVHKNDLLPVVDLGEAVIGSRFVKAADGRVAMLLTTKSFIELRYLEGRREVIRLSADIYASSSPDGYQLPIGIFHFKDRLVAALYDYPGKIKIVDLVDRRVLADLSLPAFQHEGSFSLHQSTDQKVYLAFTNF